jgi:hypothetical protein
MYFLTFARNDLDTGRGAGNPIPRDSAEDPRSHLVSLFRNNAGRADHLLRRMGRRNRQENSGHPSEGVAQVVHNNVSSDLYRRTVGRRQRRLKFDKAALVGVLQIAS